MPEEVVIERRTLERRPTDVNLSETEELRVPVWDEHVWVVKQLIVTEEIRIGQRVVEESQRISATVRRDDAHIEGEGIATAQGDELA
jgi:uncharacterized protein (TIGR02271 family)